MDMAATSAGNGIGNRGLVEGFIRARIAAAVLGNQYGGVIGIQPFAILGAIRIISAVCASRGLGIGQLDCVGKLYWRKIGDRDVDCPDKVLFIFFFGEILHNIVVAVVPVAVVPARLEALLVVCQFLRRIRIIVHLQ